MANLALCYPNRIQGATASGGDWLTALPVTNVTTRPLQQVARSTTAATTDSIILLDLGTARSLRSFALINHNLSVNAQWKISLGTTSGGTDVYAGSWTNAILATYESGLTALGVEDGNYIRNPFAAIQVLAQAYSARYVKIEIDDTANADSYIQVGRVFAGGAYIPTTNASYGLKDGIRDFSQTDRSDGGAFWFNPRRRIRNVSMVLERLGVTAEAVTLHEMLRVVGTVDEVLYVPDTEDMAYSQRFGFLGAMRELSTLEYPFYNSRSLAISIEEL